MGKNSSFSVLVRHFFLRLFYNDFIAFEDQMKEKIISFQEKTAEKILSGIEVSVDIPFERVLFALGIRYVGETVAKKLARYFKSIASIIDATEEDLIEVDEIGERIAKSVLQYFSKPENNEIINRLNNHGLKFEISEDEINTGDKLEGLSFVVSGIFKNYSRDQIKEIIEKNGGKNIGSISSKTSFIIAGDNMGPAKMQKAQKLGIPVISEEELEKMIEAN